MLEFDILLNNLYSWTYTPPDVTSEAYDPLQGLFGDPKNTGVSNTFDVRNIMTHEVGHTLSLGDLYGDEHKDLTMYGYGAKAELKKDTLLNGDYNGLQYIY